MIKRMTIVIFGLFYHFCFSQQPDIAKLNHYFDVLQKNNRFMGSVAVSRNGELVYARSTGYRNIDMRLESDINTKYRIGSVSKTFTAVLTLKAAELDMLDLNDSIYHFFPSIENADKITISHLLYHRSGIYNFTNDESYTAWYTQPKTREEMVDIISETGSVFDPDSKAEYSNSNYVLLTFILETVFNKSYEELLKKYIVNPLELQNTRLGSGINIENNECNSYKYLRKWRLEPETDISIPLGAGGLVSTPTDLVQFINELFRGSIISDKSLSEMKSIKNNYGMGLFLIPFYEKTGYGHTGGIDGFSSVFVYFPDEKISYAMMSNGTNYDNNNISIAVLSAVYDKPYDIPEFQTVDISEEDLYSYLGIYSSSQIPLKITITKEGNALIAQAAGQPPFFLEAADQHVFKFDPAGVVMEFKPEEKTFILKQGGGAFLFRKDAGL